MIYKFWKIHKSYLDIIFFYRIHNIIDNTILNIKVWSHSSWVNGTMIPVMILTESISKRRRTWDLGAWSHKAFPWIPTCESCCFWSNVEVDFVLQFRKDRGILPKTPGGQAQRVCRNQNAGGGAVRRVLVISFWHRVLMRFQVGKAMTECVYVTLK